MQEINARLRLYDGTAYFCYAVRAASIRRTLDEWGSGSKGGGGGGGGSSRNKRWCAVFHSWRLCRALLLRGFTRCVRGRPFVSCGGLCDGDGLLSLDAQRPPSHEKQKQVTRHLEHGGVRINELPPPSPPPAPLEGGVWHVTELPATDHFDLGGAPCLVRAQTFWRSHLQRLAALDLKSSPSSVFLMA